MGPSPVPHEPDVEVHTCNPSSSKGEAESAGQGNPGLQIEFGSSLVYLTFLSKKEKEGKGRK